MLLAAPDLVLALDVDKILAGDARILERLYIVVKEICPRGNNKVVIYISLYHDKCLLFMLELY